MEQIFCQCRPSDPRIAETQRRTPVSYKLSQVAAQADCGGDGCVGGAAAPWSDISIPSSVES